MSGGEAELSGGSIENTKTNGSWAVRATEDGVFKMTGGALSGDSTNGQALYVAGEKNAKLSGGTIDGGGDDKTAITVGTGAVGKLLAEGCYYYKVTLASPNGKKVTDVSGDTLSGKYIVDNRTVAQYTTDGGTTWADCDSLSEAISGAQSDSFAEANQVRLTQDVKTSIAIGFGGFTLDLQGHTWTCAAVRSPETGRKRSGRHHRQQGWRQADRAGCRHNQRRKQSRPARHFGGNRRGADPDR